MSRLPSVPCTTGCSARTFAKSASYPASGSGPHAQSGFAAHRANHQSRESCPARTMPNAVSRTVPLCDIEPSSTMLPTVPGNIAAYVAPMRVP